MDECGAEPGEGKCASRCDGDEVDDEDRGDVALVKDRHGRARMRATGAATKAGACGGSHIAQCGRVGAGCLSTILLI
jgi:hypothetical protein